MNDIGDDYDVVVVGNNDNASSNDVDDDHRNEC